MAVVAAMAAVVALASPAAAQDQSTTTVQATPSSVAVGEPVELVATVTCPNDPTGGLGVTFFAGGDLLETVPVDGSGVATYTATFDTPGSYTITAAYNGNGECFASNDTTTVEVTETPTPPTPPTPPAPSPETCTCGRSITVSGGDMVTTNN